jgi:hypothetical protein
MRPPLAGALLAVVLLGVSACGHVAPAVKFRSVEVRPMDDDRVMDDFKNHRASPVYGDVVVVENDENAGLEVVDGTLKRYRGQEIEVLGTFLIEGEVHSPFYPADYLATPRKIACWPQVPLTWLTLGIWMIIPTSYFCWSKTPDDKDHWIAWVKQIVDSAGGNLGVVTFGPKPNSIDEAKGYVLKVTNPKAPPQGPPPPPPPPASSALPAHEQ